MKKLTYWIIAWIIFWITIQVAFSASVSLIPNMTSNSAPSWDVWANHYPYWWACSDPVTDRYQIYDWNHSSRCYISDHTSYIYFSYIWDAWTTVNIDAYKLWVNAGASNQSPSAIEMQWSNDTTTWTDWTWEVLNTTTWISTSNYDDWYHEINFTLTSTWYNAIRAKWTSPNGSFYDIKWVEIWWEEVGWGSPNTAPVWTTFSTDYDTSSWGIAMWWYISDAEETDAELDLVIWTLSGVTSVSYNTWTYLLTYSVVTDFVWTGTLAYEVNDGTVSSTGGYVISIWLLDWTTPNTPPTATWTIVNNAWTWWSIDMWPYIDDIETADSWLSVIIDSTVNVTNTSYSHPFLTYEASATWTWQIVYHVNDWEDNSSGATISINWLVYIPPSEWWWWWQTTEECWPDYFWLCDTSSDCTGSGAANWWVAAVTWTTACRWYVNPCTPISEDWTWAELVSQQIYNQECSYFADNWHENYLNNIFQEYTRDDTEAIEDNTEENNLLISNLSVLAIPLLLFMMAYLIYLVWNYLLWYFQLYKD